MSAGDPDQKVYVYAVSSPPRLIPPEHSLCSNVAATGLSLFAREHARNLLCKEIVL